MGRGGHVMGVRIWGNDKRHTSQKPEPGVWGPPLGNRHRFIDANSIEGPFATIDKLAGFLVDYMKLVYAPGKDVSSMTFLERFEAYTKYKILYLPI